jgi:hypothetical protein
MSKRISRFLILLAALAATITALLANHSAGVSAQRAGVTTSTARNAAIVAATTEVLKETSELRELRILRPVKSGAQSRTEIERMLIRNLNEQMTAAEMHAMEVSLRKFGLAAKDFEYRPFIIKLLTEQVAGYYDPRVQEFHLADWLELESQKPVMAHELTHALQDQHFNLRRFEKWPHGDSDAELAAHALIEGDATLAMTIYMAKNPLVALAFSRSLSTGVATEQFNQAPRAMRESLIFPYLNGMEWATQVYKRGGWTMVSDAFTRLPLSTEQILHPEKYFTYEPPTKVVLPDVSNLLNAGTSSKQQTANSRQQTANSKQRSTGTAGVLPASFESARLAENSQRQPGTTAPLTASLKRSYGTERLQRAAASVNVLPASFVQTPSQRPTPQRPRSASPKLPAANRPLPTAVWRRIESDVNGEWGYYLVLDQFLNAPADSKRAAAGWAGDRYALYEGPNGQVFLAQVAVWDTENDAREFFDAYVKRTKLRYPGAELLVTTGAQTPNAAPETDNSKLETRNSRLEIVASSTWMTREGRVIIELRGQRVVILEGIPEGLEAGALLKAL